MNLQKKLSKFEFYWKNDLQFKELLLISKKSFCSPWRCCKTAAATLYPELDLSDGLCQSIFYGLNNAYENLTKTSDNKKAFSLGEKLRNQ